MEWWVGWLAGSLLQLSSFAYLLKTQTTFDYKGLSREQDYQALIPHHSRLLNILLFYSVVNKNEMDFPKKKRT